MRLGTSLLPRKALAITSLLSADVVASSNALRGISANQWFGVLLAIRGKIRCGFVVLFLTTFFSHCSSEAVAWKSQYASNLHTQAVDEMNQFCDFMKEVIIFVSYYLPVQIEDTF